MIYIGVSALQEYLALHVILCLIPAFFLAGGIAALFSKESVLKFFGRDTPKYISYSVAAVSGTLLAVCSCTVLPLFSGIIVEVLPAEYVVKYVGENNLMSNLTAGIATGMTYFSTLTEVPIVDSLMHLGMGKGPALTTLLDGPAISLPNVIVIARIIGLKKGLTYVFFVTIISAVAGLMFVSLV